MSNQKAKLFSSRADFIAAKQSLEERFNLASDVRWCPELQVDSGEDQGKYILPLLVTGKLKSDHLFDDVIDYDENWPEPPIE